MQRGRDPSIATIQDDDKFQRRRFVKALVCQNLTISNKKFF